MLTKPMVIQRRKAYAQNLNNIILCVHRDPEAYLCDLGCDDGNWTKKMGEAVSTQNLFGVEIIEERRQQAEKIGVKAKSANLNNQLPYGDSYFNIVHANQVIEHVPDDIQMLREVERVLIRGGKFQVDTVYKKKWARYIDRSPGGWALDPTHRREYTDIQDLISKFPPSSKIENIELQKYYRKLNVLSLFSFFSDWLRIRIPGYFAIYISGHKSC